MAFIKEIQTPDNNKYQIKNTIIPVVGTQTASTGSWTGNIDVPSLYDGLTIAYFLPWAGSGNASLKLTLNDGSKTAAIPCYISSSRLTTHYAKGTNIIMTYWSAGSIKIDGTATTEDRWIAHADYNTNTWRNIQVNGTQVLATGTGTGALNFINGTNTTVSYDSGVKIDATDEKVKLTLLETDVEKSYYIPFKAASTSIVYGNSGFVYYTKDGTTTVDGYGVLRLGNSTASGTEGNRFGQLRIYSKSTSYCKLIQADVTSNVTHTLPATGGTILNTGTTSFTRSLSSGTKIGSIKINGTSTDLYCETNTNTTYTFADGTNGFTVTPSGGTAQTVTVTPSIANNITGSGTSGYLAKFNGTHTITSGPQLGSGTTTYLRNDGAWKTPTNTKNTAGSTNSTSTLYLIGAESQAANPQTYSSQYIRIESASLAIGDTGTQGAITLYDGTSIQNRWGILKQASGVSGTVTHELPTTGGTILNSSNYDSYAATITIFTKVGTLSPGAGQYYPFTLDPEALKFKIPSKARILEFFYGNSNGENYSSLKIPVSILQSQNTTLVTFFLIGDKNQYHTYIRKRTYKITKNNNTTFTLEPNYDENNDNYNHGTTTDLTTSTIGTSVKGTFTISQSDNSIVLCEPKIISYNAP